MWNHLPEIPPVYFQLSLLGKFTFTEDLFAKVILKYLHALGRVFPRCSCVLKHLLLGYISFHRT